MGRKSTIARAYDVRKHFRRRKAAAKAGVHLPTEAELLLSMGFFKGDIVSDVREASHRWQRRLPVEVAPCGGVSDGSWGGTARRWSSGEPSLPVSLILRTEVANPALVLDEIEKIGTSRHNGNVADTMLAMLERETAARFHDPYVQAACDLSQVSWLMTANEVAGLHAPFRDRCRAIRVPDPGIEHLEHYANALLADAVRDEGLGDEWVVRLDGTELERLADHWRGGSLRKLRRLVEAVHEARRETAQRH